MSKGKLSNLSEVGINLTFVFYFFMKVLHKYDFFSKMYDNSAWIQDKSEFGK